MAASAPLMVTKLARVWAVSALIFTSAPNDLLAQSAALSPPAAQTDPIAQVSVDLAAAAFDRVLPFDVPFFIAGLAPEGTLGVEVQYAALPRSGETSNLSWMPLEPNRWKPEGPAARDQPFLVLVRTPLDAGRVYRVRFQFLTERAGGVSAVTVDGHTRSSNYVSGDVGVLYAGDIGIGAFYVGSNFYFRPVRKGAPPDRIHSIGRRLAATIGITISPVSDEDNRRRSDLFWNQSLVLGGGYRLTSLLRAGGGALIFLESDVNPLVTKKSIAATWYVSLSLDLDVAKAFR